jgi:DNA-binding NtrC family response regulator
LFYIIAAVLLEDFVVAAEILRGRGEVGMINYNALGQDMIELPSALRVLVVDDDFGDYDDVARSLRKMNHFKADFTRAKTLEAARRLIAENSYDVYLIDYNLGAECGARFVQEIGGRSGRGVAILLTGLLDRQVHDNALHAGAISCINKSDLSPTLLETTIRYALYTHRVEAGISRLVQALAQASANVSAVAKTVLPTVAPVAVAF